jgi:hypothetical protein
MMMMMMELLLLWMDVLVVDSSVVKLRLWFVNWQVHGDLHVTMRDSHSCSSGG